jgi:hypothetical protein
MGTFGFVTRYVHEEVVASVKQECEKIVNQLLQNCKADSQPKI